MPGSPIGQQQVTIRPYGRGAGGATRATGTGGGFGAVNGAIRGAIGCPAPPPIIGEVLESGGSVGPATRRGADRRVTRPDPPSRRIGEGRAGKSSRCALPTTAFFETPRRRPISAVDRPSSHSVRKRTIVSSAHSISWPPRWCNHKIRYTDRVPGQPIICGEPQKLVDNRRSNPKGWGSEHA